MSVMDSQTVEKVIKDLRLPARLVNVSERTITLDLLDDRSEQFERHSLGVSEFCDLMLDWRQKLIDRAVPASGAKAPAAPSSVRTAAAGSVSAPA
jgi:hypothetical protein